MGTIAGAHGVRGLVRVKSFAAEPASLAAYGPLEDGSARRYSLTVKGGTSDFPIAAIAGVETREAAEGLQGTMLYARREALPATGDDEFYHADLVGLEARLAGGSSFGRVRAVHDFGAGISLDIERADGDILIPFTRRAVPTIDIAGGFLVLDPPVGLLDKKKRLMSDIKGEG